MAIDTINNCTVSQEHNRFNANVSHKREREIGRNGARERDGVT